MVHLAAIGAMAKSCHWTYEIRLFAIRNFGPVIHEFDPWFNFRATQYLAENGLASFFTWFDHKSWYPLGRPVATTIYPGMQMAAVAIWRVFQALDARWSLEEVCCYVPVWFGIASTLFIALLAREAALGGGAASSAVAAAAAAAVMAVLPAQAQRSVGGGFDNESVAIPAMCATFFLWCRSLRADGAWPVAGLAGLAYGCMAASWGGHIFALNLVGLHAGALVFVGTGSCFRNLHHAYSLFVFVGTACAVQVPVVGWSPFRSAEQLGPLAVFVLIQLVWLRRRSTVSRKFGMAMSTVGAVAVLVGALLLPYGFFWPFSARVRALFLESASKTGNPLVDSVAEHQPRNRDAYWTFLHYAVYVAPLGVPALLSRGVWPSDAALFLLLLAGTSYFFSLRMSRLIVLMGPATAALVGVGAGRFFEWAMSPIHRSLHGPSTLESRSRHGPYKPHVRLFVRMLQLYNSVPARILRLAASIALCGAALPYASEFLEASFRTVKDSMSNPRIISKGADGKIIDDVREAYGWLRDKTPDDARIMSLWEYGYHIAGIGNRTSLSDGNTWNFDHIALVGLCLTSPVQDAHRIARHLADFILVWVNDDLGKTAHMARIANAVYPGHCAEIDCDEYGVFPDGNPSAMIGESLMWSLVGQQQKERSFVDSVHFRQAFLSQAGRVRIVEVLQVDQDSRAWSADPRNRLCDAPGSWYCPGQYPPSLRQLVGLEAVGNGSSIDTSAVQPPTEGASAEAAAAEAELYRRNFERRAELQRTRLPQPNGPGLPLGSYLDSCRGCSMEEQDKLRCTHCRAPGHAAGSSTLDTAACKHEGRVDNFMGTLICAPLPNAGDLPAGNFHESCQGCRLEDDGSTLRCTHCSPGDKKRPVASSYQMSRCMLPASLQNQHGVLTCVGVPSEPGIPEGNYKESCQGCQLQEAGTRLTCTHCAASDGRQRESSYEVQRCSKPGMLENRDGLLSCAGLPNQPDIPEGGYQKSCQGCSLDRGGTLLRCTHCLRADGGQGDTTLQLQPGVPCRGGPDNQDGRLVCRAPMAPASPGPAASIPPAPPRHAAASEAGTATGFPAGAYRESCEGCSLQGQGVNLQLHCARCKASDGRKRSSAVTLAGCSSVQNANGHLACA